MCCTAHAEALLRLSQGDLAQPRWSPGATAMVLHHMERLELHGIWRAETEVAIEGGTSVRAADVRVVHAEMRCSKMCSLLLSCLRRARQRAQLAWGLLVCAGRRDCT